MTGIINWFKTIFILEITGEIALKLVPPKYKEFIAFVMKLILVTAIVIPLLNLKNADISGITDEIKTVSAHIPKKIFHRLYMILQIRKQPRKQYRKMSPALCQIMIWK